MLRMADGTTYKSRLKVLMVFFRRSRGQWKEKCLSAKAALKKANNLIQWLRTSRDTWRTQAKELDAQLRQLREEKKAMG